MIVDDEDLELEALKNYVPWKSIGITDVITAYDGQEALEVCYKKNIDIIITDIKMPILDGIELARELSKISYKAKVIFLSGYDDFTFVHAAYKAGGVEYILKPFSKEEVIRVVQEAQQQLENKQTFDEVRRIFMEEQLGKLVFHGDSTVLNKLIKYDDILSSNMYFFSIHTNAPHDLLKKAIQPLSRYCLLVYRKSNIIVLYNNFCRLPNILSRIKDIILSENDVWCYFLYFEEKVDLLSISEKFDKLEEYKKYLFYISNEYIINASEFHKYEFSNTTSDTLEKIFNFEYRHEIDMLENQITLYLQEVINRKTKPAIVIENVIDICLHIMKKYIKEETNVSRKDILNKVMSSNNIEDVKKIMTILIDKAKSRFVSKGENKNDNLIVNVINYIEENYASPLTIDSLSEIVYLSPNYLRAIFKEKTGTTIHEYLTNYRMEKAIELLKKKKHKVKEISKMVGYDSESYFCATFYKMFQTTPNEYKKRHWS
ncbi:response regulator [Lachnoclostridium sp.]|nr:response regulator [Lachnoclostridium sp.]